MLTPEALAEAMWAYENAPQTSGWATARDSVKRIWRREADALWPLIEADRLRVTAVARAELASRVASVAARWENEFLTTSWSDQKNRVLALGRADAGDELRALLKSLGCEVVQ